MSCLPSEASLQRLCESIISAASILGSSSDQIVEDLQSGLLQRIALLERVPRYHSPRLSSEYFKQLHGREPVSSELERIASYHERISWPEDVILALYVRQVNRCGLCGRVLTRVSRPHVDHVVPVALGGDNDESNLQVLCADCNRGKSAHLGWPLLAPFDDRRKNLTVRYFVLARARGTCERKECVQGVRDSELRPFYRIPISKGGDWCIDNLQALCTMHYEDASRRSRSARLRFGMSDLVPEGSVGPRASDRARPSFRVQAKFKHISDVGSNRLQDSP